VQDDNDTIDDDWARVSTAYALQQESDIMTAAGLILMQRVLRDLNELPQGVAVAVDLTRGVDFPRGEHEKAIQATMFALTMSQTAVNSLTFDNRSLQDVDDILAHGRADLLDLTSTVTSLTCLGCFWLYPDAQNPAVLIEILQSMTRLRHLAFASHHPSSNLDVRRGLCLLRVPREVWRAIDFENLVNLDLSHVIPNITEQELSQITAQCRSTLTHITLRQVALWAGDGCWKRVGEVLITMLELVFVELHMIHMRDWFMNFLLDPIPVVSHGHPPGVRLEGRVNVVKGLQELSCLGSAFFEQFR
jgi:hypothetical protein